MICKSHFYLFYCGHVAKPHPVDHGMYSNFFGCPLRDEIATISASNHLDMELHKLLNRLGNGRTSTDLNTEWGEEEFWKAAADKEYGTVLLVPATVYSDASVSPSTFADWAAQGPSDSGNICAV